MIRYTASVLCATVLAVASFFFSGPGCQGFDGPDGPNEGGGGSTGSRGSGGGETDGGVEDCPPIQPPIGECAEDWQCYLDSCAGALCQGGRCVYEPRPDNVNCSGVNVSSDPFFGLCDCGRCH